MGGCATHEIDLGEKAPESKKDEVLLDIRNNLKKLEDYVIELRKEDTHYRTTKLIFMLNAIKEMSPLIRQIEDSSDSWDFYPIKPKFEEVFLSVERNDRDKCKNAIMDIREYFKNNKIPPKNIPVPGADGVTAK
jgi:hypothetical protein